jgi:hypothetical protein
MRGQGLGMYMHMQACGYLTLASSVHAESCVSHDHTHTTNAREGEERERKREERYGVRHAAVALLNNRRAQDDEDTFLSLASSPSASGRRQQSHIKPASVTSLYYFGVCTYVSIAAALHVRL